MEKEKLDQNGSQNHHQRDRTITEGTSQTVTSKHTLGDSFLFLIK